MGTLPGYEQTDMNMLQSTMKKKKWKTIMPAIL
jgi:hypothetical protein